MLSQNDDVKLTILMWLNYRIPDGLLKTYDQHEDSVYCAEWSNVDPWLFASLSYDGRVCINRVPKEYKLKFLMNSNYNS